MKLRQYIYLVSSIGIVTVLSLMYRYVTATTESVYIAGHQFNFECLFKKTTGIPCPGCWGTRSFILALHGDFWAALQLNPIGVIFLLSLVVLVILQLVFLASSLGYFQRTASVLRRFIEPKPIAILAYAVVAMGLGHWLFEIIPH